MVVLLFVIAYFPSKPPTPPSPSSDSREKQFKLESNDTSPYLFWQDTKKAMQIPEFVWLAIVGGAVGGIYNVWSGSLDTIIPNTILTTKQCAVLGASSTAAYCIGGLALGPVIDRVEYFKRRYKLAMLLLLTCSTILFIWFTLSLPFLTMNTPIFKTSFTSLAIAIIGSGFFLGCTNPLFYEFGVELTYPTTEATSGGLITIFNNAGALILLAFKTSIRTSYINFLMPGTVLGTIIIIMVFVKERYLRKDHEDLKRKEERLLTPSAATNYNGGGSSEYIF